MMVMKGSIRMMMKYAGKSGTTNIAANKAPGGLFDDFFFTLNEPPPSPTVNTTVPSIFLPT